MNPAKATGGGRSRLPRSVASMFVKVRLSSYSEQEIIDITEDKSALLLAEDVISPDHLRRVLEVHWSFVDQINQRKIGVREVGLSYNLRDIERFLALVAANSKTMKVHFQMKGEQEARGKASDDVRMLVIRTFAQVVYVERLRDAGDRRIGTQVINTHMSLDTSLAPSAADVTLDISNDFARIGMIYVKRGTVLRAKTEPAVETPELLQAMQKLLAVVQSQSPVLLAGMCNVLPESCSKLSKREIGHIDC
jgi:midasin-like AAA lid domain-containing protein